MTAIRTISVFALMTALAGCAGTQQDIATAPVKPGDEQAAKPADTGSDTVASLADSFGSDVNLPEQVSPAPAMVDVGPIDRQATAEIPVQPQYEPIEAVRAVPEPLPLGSYDTTVYEPAYQSVAAAPLVEPATTDSRSMAPIYDDPVGASSSGNRETRQHARKTFRPEAVRTSGAQPARVRSVFTPQFGARLETAALGRLNPGIRYDARYVEIGYPWGDVPGHTGVCTDVVIRSYRTLGVDLQQRVHEDMRSAFNAYPSQRIYGLKSADPNIDHRRVVNLEAFFERTGAGITVGSGPDDFQPGDVLTWRLSGNEPHIGIVVSERDRRTGYPLVVHNLGAGVRKDDLITLQTPVGHYRFAPDTDTRLAQLSRGSRKTGS